MIKIITTELCQHCNIRVANFSSAVGKLCCEDNVAKCPTIKEKIGSANQKILSEKDKVTGLSKAQGLAVARKADAENKGLSDPYVIAGAQMLSTRTEDGSYKTHAAKALITKQIIGDDGLTVLQRSANKMVNTRNIKDETGLTNFQKSATKAAETRIADVDDKGRNGYDRLWIKAGQAKPYLDTGIYFRSTWEEHFLDSINAVHGVEWMMKNVKNSIAIKYSFEGRERNYLPDFIIGNKLFEIKSLYTWDNFGIDLNLRQNNIEKLNASLEAGYDVILVLDKIEFNWKEYRKRYEILE